MPRMVRLRRDSVEVAGGALRKGETIAGAGGGLACEVSHEFEHGLRHGVLRCGALTSVLRVPGALLVSVRDSRPCSRRVERCRVEGR